MARYTADFVERGYNNRAAVPDHPRFLAQFVSLSQAAIARLNPARDLRYGPGPMETLDLFLPPRDPRGTFAFIHGGYWRTLDKSDFSYVAAPFVAEGFAVAVVNYDLCPAVTVAAIVEATRRAILWLVHEGPSHGAVAEPLVIGGHSAGGHLVAMMYSTDWKAHGLQRTPFVGGMTLSGVHDLEPLVLSSMNVDLKLDESEAQRLSPVNHAPETEAPLAIAVGAEETSEFLRQSQLLYDAWPRNHPPGMRAPLFVPRRHHFNVVLDYAEPDSDLTRATLALF